jgi:hypothetical protein
LLRTFVIDTDRAHVPFSIMKNAYKLIASLLFAFATVGCAVPPEEGSDEVVSSSLAESADANGVASTAGCATYWTCEPCSFVGSPGNRNIFVEECPDGSIRVILRRACGEDCF